MACQAKLLTVRGCWCRVPGQAIQGVAEGPTTVGSWLAGWPDCHAGLPVGCPPDAESQVSHCRRGRRSRGPVSWVQALPISIGSGYLPDVGSDILLDVEVICVTERKTVVKIDEELLAEAKEVLGTSSIVETVNRALKEVVALGARRRLLTLQRAVSASIDDPDQERQRAWG